MGLTIVKSAGFLGGFAEPTQYPNEAGRDAAPSLKAKGARPHSEQASPSHRGMPIEACPWKHARGRAAVASTLEGASLIVG